MSISGIPVILLLGVTLFTLLLFQLLTWLHYVKVPFRFHKKAGIMLFFLAIAHGFLGIMTTL
jgi:hypothetical protein